MKVLVIGSGGREHTLIWKLKHSKKVDKIFCAPGNGGIGQLARCINIKADNINNLADFATRNKIGLTVVGTEMPLAMGIVNEFQKRNLKIFGPTKEAAQLESSKAFCKEFMRKYHIPTAPFKIFTTAAEAIGFCNSVQFPVVIKADGLAAGKGVIIAKNIKEASRAIEDIMHKRIFGDAGSQIIIESFLRGMEVSVMAITDGNTILPLLSSQDYKQAFDGDRGPNTGGMGAYCPTSFTPPEIMEQINEHILVPAVKGLEQEGFPYRGVLYAGLMITGDGPKVLEFNCRFGDPETQVVLPLLKNDLADIFMATATQKLSSVGKLAWNNSTAVCVIMASKGYPGKYTTGVQIGGLQSSNDNNCYIFHAGTSQKGNRWITTGGRVLGVMGMDKNLKLALNRAYRMVNKIKFEGAMYRRDIGFRAEKPIKE